MTRSPLRLLLLLALSWHAFSQTQAGRRLTVEPPTQLTIQRGGSANQLLRVSVQPGFHVNSDKPTGEFLIPLKLTWTGDVLQTANIVYPRSEQIQVGTQRLVVFSGNFAIQTEFKVPANAPKGPALMTGKLSYQACNNQMCFRPASAEFRLPVVIQ